MQSKKQGRIVRLGHSIWLDSIMITLASGLFAAAYYAVGWADGGLQSAIVLSVCGLIPVFWVGLSVSIDSFGVVTVRNLLFIQTFSILEVKEFYADDYTRIEFVDGQRMPIRALAANNNFAVAAASKTRATRAADRLNSVKSYLTASAVEEGRSPAVSRSRKIRLFPSAIFVFLQILLLVFVLVDIFPVS